MSDTEKQVKNKINKHAFSGGQETMELHKEKGGNPDIDVPYQYLSYFEDDDEKLLQLAAEYRAGTLGTGDMKKECISMMSAYVKKFQEARTKVTDEILEEFLRPRKLEWKGNPNPTKKVEKKEEEDKKEGGEGSLLDADGKPMTKNAMKKALKLAELERKKKEKEEAAKAKQ
jgi:tryptophanyl-tRNA synthetase